MNVPTDSDYSASIAALLHLVELIDKHVKTQPIVHEAIKGIDVIDQVTGRMKWLSKVNDSLCQVRQALNNYQVFVAQLELLSPHFEKASEIITENVK